MISTPKKTLKHWQPWKRCYKAHPADKKALNNLQREVRPFECSLTSKYLRTRLSQPKNEDMIKANRKKFFDKIRAKGKYHPQASEVVAKVAVATLQITTSEVQPKTLTRYRDSSAPADTNQKLDTDSPWGADHEPLPSCGVTFFITIMFPSPTWYFFRPSSIWFV
jgi:hypothetical protein